MVSEGNYPNIALFQVSEIVYSLSRNMAYGESQIDCRLNDEIAVYGACMCLQILTRTPIYKKSLADGVLGSQAARASINPSYFEAAVWS